MLQLLIALDKAFKDNAPLMQKFPKGLWDDFPTDTAILPYACRKIVTAPTFTSYGNVHQDAVAVQISVFGIEAQGIGALAEQVDALFNDTPLTLVAVGSIPAGFNFDCRRIGAPIPLVTTFSPYKGARVIRWVMTYLYSVQN